MRFLTIVLTLACLFAGIGDGSAFPAQVQQRGDRVVPGLNGKNLIVDKEARAIVERMYAAYARCKTYSDTGTYVNEDTRMTFVTRYKRPDRIYFEFTAKNNARDGQFVYWCTANRHDAQRWDRHGPPNTEKNVLHGTAWYGDNGELEEDETLDMIVAGFTGISMGTGTTLSTMLFPGEVTSRCFSDMADLVVKGTATDRGVLCDVIYSEEHLTRAWIDQETHLLRRVSEKFDPADSEMVTQYDPKVDVPIDDKLMVFTPPRR
jgi:outer membrane lipoprotein-sorting protein